MSYQSILPCSEIKLQRPQFAPYKTLEPPRIRATVVDCQRCLFQKLDGHQQTNWTGHMNSSCDAGNSKRTKTIVDNED